MKKILFIFAIFVLGVITVLTTDKFVGEAQAVEQVNYDECTEVLAPEPIDFEERIGWVTKLKASFQWQETAPGVWNLFMDINPIGGQETWISTYPEHWGFRKPVTLPQTIIENTCETEEEPDPEMCEYNENIPADSELCVKPEEEVDPTPTPTPSPSPAIGGKSEPEKTTRLGIDELQCENTSFVVVMDVYKHGDPVKDKEVTFTFNGQTSTMKTNKDGRARTSFSRATGVVKASVDGYPDQSKTIDALDCQDVVLDPDQGGQVLGATTLADTGATDLYLAWTGLIAGLGSVITAVKYGFKK